MASSEATPPDGGWGWVVVTTAFLSCSLQIGVTSTTFVILYPDLIEAFDSTTGAVGLANLVLALTMNMSGFFVSPFAENWGLRQVNALGFLLGFIALASSAFAPNLVVFIILFGLVAGSGIGAASFSRMSCVQKYFDKNRALATGIVTLSMGLSLAAFGPLTRFFANCYGWRGALLLNAGISLHCVALSGALRPLPPTRKPNISSATETGTNLEQNPPEDVEESLQQNDDIKGEQKLKTTHSKTAVGLGCTALKSILDFRLLLDIRLDLLIIGGILMDFGVLTMLNHLPNRSIHTGIGKTKAAYLTSILGGSNFLGKIGTSVLANNNRVNIVLVYGAATVVGGLLTCSVSLVTAFEAYAAIAACSGLCLGVIFALHVTALRDTVGIKKFQRAYGIHMLLFGTVTSLSVPFGGWLFDVSQNYDVPFLVNGCFQVLGGLIILCVLCFPRQEEKLSIESSPDSLLEKQEDEEV